MLLLGEAGREYRTFGDLSREHRQTEVVARWASSHRSGNLWEIKPGAQFSLKCCSILVLQTYTILQTTSSFSLSMPKGASGMQRNALAGLLVTM